MLGAAVGGIIGHQSGRGLEGAAIGAGAGAIGGGAIGHSRDNQNARIRAQHDQQLYQQQQQDQRYYQQQQIRPY